MKILNEYTVGGSLLLIGAGFFSTRFSDYLVYELGTVPAMVPVLGGKKVTVGRVLGLVPLTMGVGILLGKMKKTPVIDRVLDLPVVSEATGFIQDLGDDMRVVIGPGSAKMAAEEATPSGYDAVNPEDYVATPDATPEGYEVSDSGTNTPESFAAETDGYELDREMSKKFTSKRVSRKPKSKISTDTSKPKGKDKPWRMSKRAETWSGAVGMARKDLGITGFEPIRKGSALYNRAKELYNKK
tara:strand:- start:1162 stop:1887 length:726 start_codon:yes stop_codon:yes gene_type:complete